MSNHNKNISEKAEIIYSFWEQNRRMPTYQEICDMFHYSSKNSASKLVQKMKELGLLDKDKKTGQLLPTGDQARLRLLKIL